LKEVPLHQEHKHRVDFIEGVRDAEEVPWIAEGGDGEEVPERRWKEGG
jgi:hypothetical protein